MSGEDALDARLVALSDRQRLLTTIGLLAVAGAKMLVPRRTGNLARTIRVDEVTDDTVRVVAGGVARIGYARMVEYGTRAHDIVARPGHYLRWAPNPADRRLTGSPRVGAKVIFRKRVHHPGTKPHPYLIPGAQKAISDVGLTSELIKTWNEAA